jgi:hypothetical protein
MSRRRYFSLGEPIVNHDMHCSDEVLDMLIYNLDVFVCVLLVVAESLVLDVPGTDFFISGEIANTLLAHSVEAESMAQKKFRSCSEVSSLFRITCVGSVELTRAPKIPVPVHPEVLVHDWAQVNVVRLEVVGLCRALACQEVQMNRLQHVRV